MANQWYAEFTNKYKAGISHSFLFNFNVRDYVDNKRELDRYICDEFLRTRNFSIIAYYDISRGLSFPDAAMEREFRKIALNGAAVPLTAAPSKIFPLIDTALISTKVAVFLSHAEMIAPNGSIRSPDQIVASMVTLIPGGYSQLGLPTDAAAQLFIAPTTEPGAGMPVGVEITNARGGLGGVAGNIIEDVTKVTPSILP